MKKEPIRVLMVCHGNICRSTMAQSVMQHMINARGLKDEFYIDSAATSREEIGNTPHYGTVAKLRQVGIDVVPHRARQMTQKDYDEFDYLIGMDTANIRNMNHICGGDPQEKIYKMLSFAGYKAVENGGSGKLVEARDVADPWYTGDFDATYKDVVDGLEGFISFLGY